MLSIASSDVGLDPEIKYACNGAISIAYRVIGDGPRDLMLVLPWASNLEILDDYEPVAEALEIISGIARVIVFDRRGTGLSDRLCGPATLEEGMDDMLAVLDATGSSRAAMFAMHEAGTLAMLFAATHPERVSHLTLYGTFATTTWQPDYPWGQKPEERQQQIEFVMETWGTAAIAGFFNPTVSGDEEFLRWAGRWQRASVSRDALPRFFEILGETDVRHVLETITLPTLILHRTRDPAVPVDNARYLNEHIPRSELIELPGEDHLPFLGDWRTIVGEIEEFITGTRRDPEPDRVLATILFCDVVQSSRLVSELGDRRWGVLLDRLDQVVSQGVKSCGGRVVKRLGDGYLVTFDRPARAIRSACLIRDAVADLGVVLRFALHTGEVEVRGEDIGGIAVHIAARVLDAARPGEVLVSSAIPPLIAGSGLEFDDRGSHRLRGIPGEWSLYALEPGLRT